MPFEAAAAALNPVAILARNDAIVPHVFVLNNSLINHMFHMTHEAYQPILPMQ